MKRFQLTLLSLAVAILTLTSCMSSEQKSADNLLKFVEKTREECDKYTSEQWATSQQKFNELITEYNQISEKLSEETQKSVNQAIGTYTGLTLKAGASKWINELKGLKDTASGIIQGLGLDTEQIGSNVETLSNEISTIGKQIEDGLNSIAEKVDTVRLRESIEKIGTSIE